MDTSIDLSEEVMEDIVSRCPVKSVVRFKSLSKSWHSIISEPRFSIRRLENQNDKNKLFLFLAPQTVLHTHIYLMRLVSDAQFIIESEIPYPSPIFDIPLCSCNGLFLFRGHHDNPRLFLWNPSIRKHIIINGPRLRDCPPPMSHMYYDSVTDDYKIVFVYKLCYTVYSCKNKSWSEMKDLPCDIMLIHRRGASIGGCFYGMDVDNAQVVCFDAKDGNVHKFPLPGDVKNAYALREDWGRLYCHGYSEKGMPRTCVLEKHGNKWTLESSKKKDISTRSVKKWVFTRACIFNMDQELVVELFLLDDNYRIMLKEANKLRGIEAMRARYDRMRKYMRDGVDVLARESDQEFMSRIFPYSENVYMPCSNI